MRTSEQHLHEILESTAEQVVAASHAAAVAALDRAFGRTARLAKRPASSSARRSNAPRRSPEELAELGERFLEVVGEEPGQTMAVLAPKVGASAGQLQVPAARLRREGQIRTAGQRQFKRYFPVGTAEAAT